MVLMFWLQVVSVPIMVVMMIIAPNSRAYKGKKVRGEVKGNMEELEVRRRGMLTGARTRAPWTKASRRQKFKVFSTLF